MGRTVIGAALLLAAGIAFAATAGDESGTYRALLFLHQLLFVFWLGPDIGIYMWGTKASNTELTVAQRVAAARIMRVIDVIPKVCMSLMLTVGGILTELKGIPHPWWQMAGIVLLGPVWLTLTLLTYVRSGTEAGANLARLDEQFRWLVVAVVTLSVIYSSVTDRLAEFPWVTAKILLFAAIVFFGIMVRRRLAPFNDAVERLNGEGDSHALNGDLAKSIAGSRPFVIATWIALAMAAGLGTFQPGTPETPAATGAAGNIEYPA
jgi:hypothetical protein